MFALVADVVGIGDLGGGCRRARMNLEVGLEPALSKALAGIDCRRSTLTV
jgi:hypothetical protein